MEITFTQPDDMHVHLRDGDALRVTVPATAKQFARAIVMPNLKPAVNTTAQASTYRDRILAHVPKGLNFQPLMTLYLNTDLSPEEIHTAKQSGIVYGVKLYPQGATTNAQAGVGQISEVFPILAAMEKASMPLLIHGESIDPTIDIFDREKSFIDQTLAQIIKQFPTLKIVLEHITTKDAVDFILESSNHLAATITPHHLMYNRTNMLSGGINPHLYCMPILKRETHRQALIKAATSGNPKFFLGTDTAPHEVSTKLSSCGCAGIFSALSAIECYAAVFDSVEKLYALPAFASHFGADFYGLPRNAQHVTLHETEKIIPQHIDYLDGKLIPLCAGQTLPYTLEA